MLREATDAVRYNLPQRSCVMSTAMHEWPRRHRITVDHFYRMGEAGLFDADERVELVLVVQAGAQRGEAGVRRPLRPAQNLDDGLPLWLGEGRDRDPAVGAPGPVLRGKLSDDAAVGIGDLLLTLPLVRFVDGPTAGEVGPDLIDLHHLHECMPIAVDVIIPAVVPDCRRNDRVTQALWK